MTQKGSNIILIGMPGAGKSTCGVILAKILAYDFIDSDLVIQKKTGKKLPDLIRERGVDGFIRLDEEINASIEASVSVIATGGSVVYGVRAMEHFRRSGTVVYLKVSYEELERRLIDIAGRGVVLRDGQTLAGLYRERTVLYEKYADITICEEIQTPEGLRRLSTEEVVTCLSQACGTIGGCPDGKTL